MKSSNMCYTTFYTFLILRSLIVARSLVSYYTRRQIVAMFFDVSRNAFLKSVIST